MTKEERFKMNMLDEFKQMCEIVEKGGRIIINKQRMLKALEQEPKTGQWEEVQFRTIPYNRISKAKKCPVCGKRKDKYVIWNYCPNCGCRMMGVEE